jgi:hypothetical protein
VTVVGHIRREKDGIERICRFIQGKNVGQLERLATAAWIRTEEGIRDTDAVATRLNHLKPHVGLRQAREADEELLGWDKDNGQGVI